MLHTSIPAIVTAAFLAVGPALALVPSAAAVQAAPQDESQNDLRKENDRLRQQIRTLEGDLDAALKRIQELESRLAAAPAAAPGSAQPVVTPVPADPALGPGGLLSMLQADYNGPDAGFAGKPLPDGPGTDQQTRQAWAAHQRALESWITREQRKVTEVQWTGTIDPASVERRGREVAMVVVFENGGRDYRAPLVVDSGTLDRLRASDGTVTGNPVVVNAVVTPRLRINPMRADTGPFDNPPLVAPFVEFGYDLKVRVILPADKAKPATPKT